MTQTSTPWYESEDDFNAIVAMLPFEESTTAVSFSEWRERMKAFEDEMHSRGQISLRQIVKPAAIKAWVEERGLDFCWDVVTRYAYVKAAEMLSRGGSN